MKPLLRTLVICAASLYGCALHSTFVHAANSPHTDYRTGYNGGCGNSAACHTIVKLTFLSQSLDTTAAPNERDYTNFCLSCHNPSGEAHDKSAGSPSTNVYTNLTGFNPGSGYRGVSHSWNGQNGNAGTRTPMATGFKKDPATGSGTDFMPGGKVRCQTCHDSMLKSKEDNTPTSSSSRQVVDTSTSDYATYTMLGYSSCKQYLSQYVQVYRDSAYWTTVPARRARKEYMVDPSEYTFDYASGDLTFTAAQEPTAYVYVEIPQPYLRVTNQSNIACLDCHNNRSDDRVSHEPGTGAKDNHPVAVSYGHSYGLDNTLKGSPTGNAYVEGGQVLCTSCHDPHNAASNDGQILREASGSELCADCHDTSFLGYTGKVANHDGAKHAANGQPATLCLDCHTTHDSNNILLIRDKINGKKITFRNFSGEDSFGDDTGGGVCEVCHSPSAASPNNYHRSDGSGNGHRPRSKCTACHKHDRGFNYDLSVSCDGCHGTPPVNSGGLVVSPNPTGSTTPGAHDRHSNALGYTCGVCHLGGMTDGSQADHVIKLRFSFNGYTSGIYDGQTTLTNGYSYSAPNTSGGTRECSGTYCHSNGTRGASPFTGVKKAAWGGSVACGDCHRGDLKHGQGYSTMSTGSHTRHVTSYGYACADCHFAAGEGTTRHADRIVNIRISKTLGSQSVSGGFIGQTTAGASYGKCSGVYCHSNASPLGGANNYSTIKWGGSTACTSCHGGPASYASIILSVGHKKHVGTDYYGFTCSKCHNGTVGSGNSPVTDNTKHVDGDKDVEFDSANPSGTYTASPSCNTLYCHSDGQSLTSTGGTVAWNGNADCRSCHSGDAGASPTMTTGKHTAHINSGSLGAFRCTACHVRTVAGNTAIDGFSYHVNGVKNVNFTTATLNNYTGSYTASYTCRNVYCHSSGQARTGTAPNYSTPSFRVASSWTGAKTSGCNACHGLTTVTGAPDYANRSTASKVWFNGHDKHASSGADCIKCHRTVVDVFGGITAGTVKHINGARDVSFRLGGSYDAALKRCSGTDAGGCHSVSTLRWGGFSPACSTCHGQLNGVAVGSGAPGYRNWTTAGTYPAFESYSGGGGAHYSHVTKRGYQCGVCHYNGGPNNPANHHNLSPDTVYRDNVDVDVAPQYYFNNHTTKYDRTRRNCTNVRCHYGVSQDWDCDPLH